MLPFAATYPGLIAIVSNKSVLENFDDEEIVQNAQNGRFLCTPSLKSARQDQQLNKSHAQLSNHKTFRILRGLDLGSNWCTHQVLHQFKRLGLAYHCSSGSGEKSATPRHVLLYVSWIGCGENSLHLIWLFCTGLGQLLKSTHDLNP
jgi:hypothetical protein